MSHRIAADTLLDYIPHRPPMVWIDYVSEFSETGGTAVTVLKADGLYMSGGFLRASACIELVAQAFAFNNAAYYTFISAPENAVKRAFLAAIKDFRIVDLPQIPVGAELRTVVKKERQLGPISLIHGQTFWGERLIARGELKVYAQ